MKSLTAKEKAQKEMERTLNLKIVPDPPPPKRKRLLYKEDKPEIINTSDKN